MKAYLSILTYLGTAAGANLALAALGQWAMPLLALIFIGLDMTMRDYLHHRWENSYLWPRMFSLILFGSLLSFLINPASLQICIASGIAFLLSGITDAIIYSLLFHKSWSIRSNVSNLGSSLIDSLIFPLLTFALIDPLPCLLSFIMKMLGGFVCTIIISSYEKWRLYVWAMAAGILARIMLRRDVGIAEKNVQT